MTMEQWNSDQWNNGQWKSVCGGGTMGKNGMPFSCRIPLINTIICYKKTQQQPKKKKSKKKSRGHLLRNKGPLPKNRDSNSSGFEGGKDLRVFFSIHSLVPGQFLCQTFLLVILFHIFPSCIAIDHFWGIFSWPLPFFPNKFLPTFSSPPARPSWDPWHHGFFG